ncbi:MAG: hypothetical protein PHS49_05030 [Candidatus Gracilibacteria bacterium]|nr:hypothetical protein [Candidatus Gracilibacteria bacterium]
MKKIILSVIATLLFFASATSHAEEKVYKIGWSFYAYWYQWEYAKRTGIVKKWEDKKGVKLQIIQASSYSDSLDLFRNGKIDAVTITNGDAWSIATSKKIKFPINGDFSSGSDVVFSNECTSLKDCVDNGTKFRYDNDSVSDMLFFACLKDIGVDIRSVPAIQAAESDIVIAFEGDKKASAITWKPFVNQVKNVNNLCSSAQYPGYIVDGLAVSADMPDAVIEALVGIWYEVVGSMNNDQVLTAVAAIPGDSLESYKDQLSTTFRLDKPKDAIDFMSSEAFINNMKGRVHDWLFSTGLTASDVDKIGVKFPNGTVIGNQNNVTLEFDARYVKKMLDAGEIK